MREVDYNTWTIEDLQSLHMEITNIIKRKDLDAVIEWADACREKAEGVGLSDALIEIVSEVYNRAYNEREFFNHWNNMHDEVSHE